MKIIELKKHLKSDKIIDVYLLVDLGGHGHRWVKSDKASFLAHINLCLYTDTEIFAANVINGKLYIGRD